MNLTDEVIAVSGTDPQAVAEIINDIKKRCFVHYVQTHVTPVTEYNHDGRPTGVYTIIHAFVYHRGERK